MKRKFLLFFLFFFFLFTSLYLIYKPTSKKDFKNLENKENYNSSESSNLIKNVRYISKDAKGNEYIIEAMTGEIDQSNAHIIYLTKVNAIIRPHNSDSIVILSDYGKYNTKNFDTIFSKNVIITYTDNKIKSDYLDFSLKRNSMIISKNVSYSNLNNVLKADNVEIDLKSKDTKIFMFEDNKKVNVKSKN